MGILERLVGDLTTSDVTRPSIGHGSNPRFKCPFLPFLHLPDIEISNQGCCDLGDFELG